MLQILYRDETLVAVNKPAGLLVHRTAEAAHARSFLLQRLRDQIQARVYPVHRLDRPTSGVLLFALNRGSANSLMRQFSAASINKTYLAVVRGWPVEQGVIDHPLKRPPPDTAVSQSAVTVFERLARAELNHRVDRYPSARYALLKLQPKTGRRHQLRRHLKHIHHPLIGDTTYGKGRHNRFFKQSIGSQRLLLHAWELEFCHPETNDWIQLQAPLDDQFQTVLELFNWPSSSNKEAL